MAIPQNRKRQRTHEALPDGRPKKAWKTDTTSIPNERSAKRPRRDQTVRDKSATESANTWHYPPEFWDRLSTIPLIREALEELDRRIRNRPSFPPPCPPTPSGLARDLAPTPIPTTVKDLARFARHGGPDLCDLRGYPAPAARNHRNPNAMSQSSGSRATKSTNPTTIPKSGTSKTRKSISAYNRGFEQHLTDHDIHATWKSQKPVLTVETKAALVVPRPSLSPSRFSDSAFETFQQTNAQAKDEDDVLADVIPTIIGIREANYPSARNTVFGHLQPLTDGTIAPPKPDIYYGAIPEQLDPAIRDELVHYITPSTAVDKPIAPNFFIEAKGPDGSAAVMMRQARYDGAVGARGIHYLQNHGQDPVYDGNAYTFSSTYHSGTLKMYAHHATPPTKPEGRPEYHMTQLRGFDMTDSRESFIEGATAFRNARDLARQHRDTFVRAANLRYQAGTAAAQETLAAAAEARSETASSSQDVDGVPLGIPDEQNSQQPEMHSQTSGSMHTAAEQAASATTSFTSSLTSGKGHNRHSASSKRHRDSQSPPSGSHRSKNHDSANTDSKTRKGPRE